jgi:hypothetical protein
MSVWSSFLDSIAKPFGKAVGEGGKNVLDFVGQAFPGVPAPANALNQIVLPAAVQLGTSQILNKTNLESSAQAGIKQNLEYNLRTSAASNDLTLKIAHDVVEPIISEGITRPGSTLMLLTDSTSPLYQPGKYEKGFQLNDIKAAYNRSEKVSVFAAMTKSDLMSASIPQATVDYFSDINFKDVNLWDDENLKKNYSDNAVGRYYTGVGDFIVGNVLIAAAGGGVARVAGSIGRAGGISTKGKAITQFEKEINDGFLYTDTVGAQGKFSTAADDFRLISETDDINQIIIRAEKYTDNPRMIDALAEATDKNVIRDLILADKGYAPALERLLKTEPALIGDVANVTTTFKAKALDDGGVYHPEGDALDRINALYNDGMRLPQHKKYYETVMDPQNKSFLGGGRDYFPMEPILGARQLAALKDRVSATKSGLITRDFTDIGGFEERILGNKLITRAIRFTGTYKPLGYVTFSGARPMDGVVELHAMLDDIPLFNSGTNVIKLTPPGIAEKTMKASEYRSKIISDFTRAENNIARKKVLEDIDDSLGLHMGYTHGFFDEDAIRNFTQLLRGRISNSHNQFSTKGMGIDAQGRRVTTDPYTQRQLVESYRLAPWNIIEKEIRDAAESRALKRSGTKMADASKAIFENINRYWTFDVLARPSYIPKQSLAEPILSAFLAQGLVYVADAVPTMTRNILKNNRNRVLGVASKIHNRSELKSIQDVVEAKSTQLDIAVNQLNTLTAEYASFITDSISPASRFYNGPKVKKALDDAQNLVDEIELDLMSAVKPFGRMEPVPTLASLERRIAFLERSSKQSENPVELFPGLEKYLDGGNGGLPGSRTTVGFVKVEALKDMPGNTLSNFEGIDAVRKSIRDGKGFATREFEGKPFQDPIMVVYNNETGLAYVGEGNHRLQAAIAEGIPYVPVRVVRGSADEMVASGGRKPKQIKNDKDPQFPETVGTNIGKVRDPEYIPPTIHPSYVFDKKFIVKEDKFTKVGFLGNKYGQTIANAKAALGAARGELNTLILNPAGMLAKNKEIATQYELIDKALKELGESYINEANLLGKSAKYKERYTGKQDNYRMVGGKWTRIDKLTDENHYGAAMKEELSNNRTVETTYLGESSVGTRQSVIMRKAPDQIVDVSNPLYFEELAYVINRAFRGDPLVNKILSNVNFKDLVAWGQSPSGIAYMEQFGGYTIGSVPDFIRSRVSFVNRYIPNKAVQAKVLEARLPQIN